MVDEQIRPRGTFDERVLAAMLEVPREKFVPRVIRPCAYDDRALPVGHDQTISQPFIVAYMTDRLSLSPTCRVLEVGTGTGYQTAILARLSQHVYTIERIAALQEKAAKNLAQFDIPNISLSVGDGTLGLPEHAPFDRIIVTAAAPHVPQPLVDQLVDGGRLVIPVGGKNEQSIVCVDRRGTRTVEQSALPCRFVKLIGQQGWKK